HPRADFGSVALGWTFSEEPFFNSDWFNFGKLRLSWGSNGNRDVGEDRDMYIALSDLTTGKYLYVLPDGTVIQASQLWVNRMQNPNFRWERNTSYNLGLDFALFNNRIDGNLEFYQMNSTDLLVLRSLPNVTGFDNVMDNLGEVRNRGFEVTLNSLNINRENFSWRSTALFQLNRNAIQHIYRNYGADGRELDDVQNRWFIGRAIDAIWDWRALGVYQLGEEGQAARYRLRPGDYKLEDVNNDGQFSNADRQFLGFTEPRFSKSEELPVRVTELPVIVYIFQLIVARPQSIPRRLSFFSQLVYAQCPPIPNRVNGPSDKPAVLYIIQLAPISPVIPVDMLDGITVKLEEGRTAP